MWNPLNQVRPDERRVTLASFAVLFAIMGGHALVETARDALFLAALPPSRLPWVYMAIAVAAFGITLLQRATFSRLGGRAGLSAWLLGSALTTLVFWQLCAGGRSWSLYALYAWSGVFVTLVLARFWTLAGELFTVRQAKRLFAVIGAGSVLGAIAGSALARFLAAATEARSILLAAAVSLFLAAFTPLLMPSGGRRFVGFSSRKGGFAPWRTDVRIIVRDAYVRRVALLVLLSTITLTLVDYIFKSTVATHVEAEQLGRFFATAYLVLNVISLVAQLFLVAAVLRLVGVSRALILLPAFIVGGAVALMAGGGIVAALALKAGDGGLRHSLHRTAIETVYVPLSDDMRARIKAFVDVGGQRGGQAIASLGILGILALGGDARVLAGATVLLAIAWIVTANELRTHYLDLFRATLAESAVRTSSQVPALDVHSLETLMAALNSADDAEVLATLDLLEEQDRVRLVPALLLYHPSSAVVSRTLELFGKWGRDDLLPMVPRLLESPDPQIRAAALRAASAIDPDRSILMKEFLDDEEALVRATALVGLISSGWLDPEEARRAMRGISRDASNDEGIALARAIWHQPDPGFVEVLLELARSEHMDVRREVARAMHEVGVPEFLPLLLPMLAQRQLREAARRAVVGMGDDALAFLDDALSDLALDPGIRRHLPRTISRFGGALAAEVLVRHLLDEPDDVVSYKILRGLGRLRADDHSLVLDAEILREATAQTLGATFELVEWALILGGGALPGSEKATPVRELLLQLLEHHEAHLTERLFRLLGLQYALDDIRPIYRGLRNPQGKVRAGSRELLEHLIPTPLRGPVLSLVDELPSAQRLAGSGSYYRPRGGDDRAVLGRILDGGSESLVGLAIYHIAELGWRDLGARFDEFAGPGGGFLVGVVESARARLLSPLRETMSYE